MLTIPTNCGGGKNDKEQAATVVFSIDDAFQLEKGLVITGEILTGTVRVGDEMIHYNDVGEKVFTCKIVAIEQPPNTGLKEASADAQRRHFGFLIEGKTKADFDTGGYLTDGDLLKWIETLKDDE
jgi:selenocysteine-specific translation elongation factor